MSAFTAELKRAIHARGIRHQDLAAQAELSVSAVSSIVNGRTTPRHETAVRLADALDWNSLIAISRKVHEATCQLCEKTFVSAAYNPHITRYCSEECARSANTRNKAADHYETVRLERSKLRRMQAAINDFCNGCEPEGLCRDNECPIRPHSPLPFIPLSKVRPA